MKKESGQSLFEVVVALFLATIVVVAISVGAVFAIKNTRLSRDRSRASDYTEELLEWLRGQRDTDWEVFAGYAAVGTWCFQELAFEDPGVCGESDFIPSTGFKREASFSQVGGDVIEVVARVFWQDVTGDHDISAVTNFTNWKSL